MAYADVCQEMPKVISNGSDGFIFSEELCNNRKVRAENQIKEIEQALYYRNQMKQL